MMLCYTSWFRLTDDYKSKKDVLKSSDFLRRPQKLGPSSISNVTKILFISVKSKVKDGPFFHGLLGISELYLGIYLFIHHNRTSCE